MTEELVGAAELAQLEADLRRVTDRLRSRSAPQLAAEVAPYSSRADAARQLAQALADVALGIASADDQQGPHWRELPALSDFAVGDMVAVTGRDLLELAAGLPRDRQVWTRTGRRAAKMVIGDLIELLVQVRRLV